MANKCAVTLHLIEESKRENELFLSTQHWVLDFYIGISYPSKSFIIYEFFCRCEARYVGRTTQRLGNQLKQHVPTSIRKKTHIEREQPHRGCKTRKAQNKCDSAISQHLLENQKMR